MPATAPAPVAAETVASAPRLVVDSPRVPGTESHAHDATNVHAVTSDGARESSAPTSAGSEPRLTSLTSPTSTTSTTSGTPPRATKTTRRVVVVVACVALAALLVYAWRATQPSTTNAADRATPRDGR